MGTTSSRPAGSTAAAEPPQPTWYELMRAGYDQVVNAIIRPPRARYAERDLGPKEFVFRGRAFERTDVVVTNKRGQKMLGSHWQPKAGHRPAATLPCVVYLHGNSSCRLGCLENLEIVLAMGASVFSFDMTGSGLSDGEFVTLGWNEKDDLAAVIDHLRSTGTVSTVALWGRSMGAATSLLHAHRDPSIAGMILDSPFADLRQLATELVDMGKAHSGYRVPTFVVAAAIRMVRSTVLKKTGMDIFNLTPIADVDKSFVPALFVAASSDNFIPPHHSRQIHEKYAGDKNLVVVAGDHNSQRPRFFMDSASIFLRNVLQIPDTWELPTASTLAAYSAVLGTPGAAAAGAAGGATPAPAGATAAAGVLAAAPTTTAAAGGGTPAIANASAEGGAAVSRSLVVGPDAVTTSALAVAGLTGVHVEQSLMDAWRAAGGEDAVDAAEDAIAAAAAAEDAMIQQALMASMVTASAAASGVGAGAAASAAGGPRLSTIGPTDADAAGARRSATAASGDERAALQVKPAPVAFTGASSTAGPGAIVAAGSGAAVAGGSGTTAPPRGLLDSLAASSAASAGSGASTGPAAQASVAHSATSPTATSPVGAGPAEPAAIGPAVPAAFAPRFGSDGARPVAAAAAPTGSLGATSSGSTSGGAAVAATGGAGTSAAAVGGSGTAAAAAAPPPQRSGGGGGDDLMGALDGFDFGLGGILGRAATTVARLGGSSAGGAGSAASGGAAGTAAGAIEDDDEAVIAAVLAAQASADAAASTTAAGGAASAGGADADPDLARALALSMKEQ